MWCWRRLLESPLDCKEIKPVNPKGNQPWLFIGRTDAKAENPITLATWCKEPTHWKRCWYRERLRAGAERGNRGWDGWMASATQWTWVWANSRRSWRTGKPGVLQSMASQRVGHNLWLNTTTIDMTGHNNRNSVPLNSGQPGAPATLTCSPVPSVEI